MFVGREEAVGWFLGLQMGPWGLDLLLPLQRLSLLWCGLLLQQRVFGGLSPGSEGGVYALPFAVVKWGFFIVSAACPKSVLGAATAVAFSLDAS